MGAFEGGTGGPLPGSSVDIPVPNLSTQAQEQAAGLAAAGWWDSFWAKHAPSVVGAITPVLVTLVSIVDTIAASLLQIYGAIQGGHSPGTFSLAAAAVSDLLGTDVDSGTLQAAYQRGSNAAMSALGGAVFNQLKGELSPAGNPIQPIDGINAALSFLGYGLQFAVREGNLEFITSLIPEEWRVGEGLRTYGSNMARNLGLGRLTRLALQPLFKIFIQDPMTWYYNQLYTPTLLGASVAIKAFNRGQIGQDVLNQELAYAGYSSAYQAVMATEALGQKSVSDLYTQFIHADPNLPNFQQAIQNLGYSQQTAEDLMNVTVWNDADTFLQEMAETAYTKALSDPTQAAAFQQYVLNLWPGGNRAQFWAARLQDDLATPRKFLSWSEVQDAVVAGILAISDADAFLSAQGYGPNDLSTLMLLMLQKLSTDEAKVAIAKYSYEIAVAKAQKAGIAIPPPPALLAGEAAS